VLGFATKHTCLNTAHGPRHHYDLQEDLIYKHKFLDEVMAVLDDKMDDDNDTRGKIMLENIKSYNIKFVSSTGPMHGAILNGWKNSCKMQMVILILRD
jgi:hypothetical protein